MSYPGGKRDLLPADEIQNSIRSWGYTPVTVGHPSDRGRKLDATHPEVVEDEAVGHFMEPKYDRSDNALVGNVYLKCKWLDNHARGEEIVKRINNGETLEVSTSYFAPGTERVNGQHDGQKYNRIQRDIQPNHFAILLDEKGNCSVEEGCGLPIANDGVDAHEVKLTANLRNTARDIQFGGTETRADQPWGDVGKDMATWWEGYTENSDASGEVPQSYADAPSGFKDWQSGRNLLGERNADTWAEANDLPVVNPLTDQLNEGGLIAAKAAVSGARGATYSPQQESSVTDSVNNLLVDNFDFEASDFEDESMDNQQENAHMLQEWSISEANNWLDRKQFGEAEEMGVDEDWLIFWQVMDEELKDLTLDKEPLGMEKQRGVQFIEATRDMSDGPPEKLIAAVKFYHGGTVENADLTDDVPDGKVRQFMNMMKNFFFGNQTRIGDWIAARREEMEMTQEDLAAELPIAASTLGSIENGEIETPSQPVLEALADAFDVDVSTVEGLLNEGEEPADMVAENRKFIEEGSQANDNDCNCEETMDNRQQLVTDIVSNSDWEEDELEGFSDDHVEKLSNTVETAEADEAEADEQEADTETASADDSGQADEDIRSVVREEVSDVLEEQLENNEALGQVQNALDDKREHYIKTIVSNSSFDEDELRDDSTERLRKTAREVTDNDYSLNNPSRPTANEDSSGAPARPNIVRNSEED